jgi:periplasmic protein CpxP/Spy
MSRPGNKNLLIIIAVLLLTNIGVLGYFLWYKKPEKATEQRWDQRGNNGNGIQDLLQKDVGFSTEQLAQYKQMKDKQRETIRPMYDEMRKAKDSLFRLLKDSAAPDSLAEKAADLIAHQQKTLDLQTFIYFRKVRTLCTPEQQPKYDSLIQNMFTKMNRPQRRTDGDSTKTDKKN